jgi:hypothetical protein
MKKILLCFCPALFFLSLTVCANSEDNVQPSSTGGDTEMAVTIQVGNRKFTVLLFDNNTTRALIARMPMTISMSELNGNEKYYYMPDSLPADERSAGNIHTGDLMLYGSDCLVLFYKNFSTAYRYTKLGLIEDTSDLADALVSGSVQVTFSIKS